MNKGRIHSLRSAALGHNIRNAELDDTGITRTLMSLVQSSLSISTPNFSRIAPHFPPEAYFSLSQLESARGNFRLKIREFSNTPLKHIWSKYYISGFL